MKTVLTLLIAMLIAAPVWAQQKMKIGFVDVQRAIGMSQAGKLADKNFQADVQKIEGSLNKEKDELEQLKADLDKKGLLLNEEQKRNLEREFQRRYLEYQRKVRDSQDDLRIKRNEAMGEILKGIEASAAEVGKKENFTLILTRNQLLYVDQGVDITQKVVDLYDSRITDGKVQNK